MTPGQAQKAIEKILTSNDRKSDKARALFALGLEKTEVVELVPMNYSQAHSVWRSLYGNQPRSSTRVSRVAGVPELRPEHGNDRGRLTSKRALYLTPAQTRYITQDGHVVIRVDRDSGAYCYNCEAPVHFSLTHLGFVHKWSTAEPTDIEDRYAE